MTGALEQVSEKWKVIIPAIPRKWGDSGYKWLVHFNRALRNEKLLFLLFQVGGEAVATNDWCIITGLWEMKSYYSRYSP